APPRLNNIRRRDDAGIKEDGPRATSRFGETNPRASEVRFGGTNPRVFGVAFWRNEPKVFGAAFWRNEPKISIRFNGAPSAPSRCVQFCRRHSAARWRAR